MPLTWEDCFWHGDMSQEGRLGSYSYCLVFQNRWYTEEDKQWIWSMGGLPPHSGVPAVGYAGTRKEAKKAANEVFDQWLKKAGLMIAPDPPQLD